MTVCLLYFFALDVVLYFEVEAALEWPSIMLMMHASVVIDVGYSADGSYTELL